MEERLDKILNETLNFIPEENHKVLKEMFAVLKENNCTSYAKIQLIIKEASELASYITTL